MRRNGNISFVGFALIVLFVLSALPGCNKWVPPDNGVCNEGRQWVSPHQEGNRWYDGYCEDM